MTSIHDNGKSPEYDRCIAMLRRGMAIIDVSLATNIPTRTLKKWAQREGIPIRRSTAAEIIARAAKFRKNAEGRRKAARNSLGPDRRNR